MIDERNRVRRAVDGALSALVPGYARYCGNLGRKLARQMERTRVSGVVVEYRGPVAGQRGRVVHPQWLNANVSVPAIGWSHTFFRKGPAWFAAPSGHIAVIASSTDGESVECDFDRGANTVEIVSIFPRVVVGATRTTAPRLKLLRVASW